MACNAASAVPLQRAYFCGRCLLVRLPGSSETEDARRLETDEGHARVNDVNESCQVGKKQRSLLESWVAGSVGSERPFCLSVWASTRRATGRVRWRRA